MKLPQEIEMWYIIPAIRSELAKFMLSNGLKQRQIAEKLDLTEPAVSQYLKAKRGNEIKFNNKILSKIKESAIRITNEKSSLMKELQNICTLIKKEKILCSIHKNYDKVLKNCDVCLR